MTSRAIDPQENRATGATHWCVYDDDPRVDWHFGPFERQAETEAYAQQRNETAKLTPKAPKSGV